MLTTVKTSTGCFDVYWNGQKTAYEIVNGSLGVSGRGTNTYGIVNHEKGSRRWVGSLAACKKILAHTFGKVAA